MRTSIFGFVFFVLGTLVPTTLTHEPNTPTIPNTGVFPVAENKPPQRTLADMQPVHVRIPAIGLNSPVQNMGVLPNGALAVPSGKTKNVGWYAAGTLPGQVGSAVFDAHIFAAFVNLHKLKAGDDIYVTEADGTVMHFVAKESVTYPLSRTPANLLYSQTDQPRLNLITCAGHLTADRSTYDHRLIVYATLA